ncbi:putative transporter YfdV [Oxobacter pfennigii]|uniref:Putative transporter YfdV n=1 Tax=Oxobacter pfennigii TaxID=36849 RepID=A0A0P8WA20_9CLOT|nr:AEC family transporter [Oxobacter pfennigii]KPU44812.1 putative transporter YfdV [Oxobacter pfennigii]
MYNQMAVINQVIILSIVMVIGIIARKKGFMKDQVRNGITDLLLYVTLPLMIVSSFDFDFSKDMLLNAGAIAFYSFIVHGGLFFLSKFLYYKFPKDVQSVLRYVTVFSNAAFMGFPILEGLYGKIGIFYASIYNIPFRIFMWTLGIALFSDSKEGKSIKGLLLNPGIVAVYIGMVLFFFSIKLPSVITEPISMVGSMTTPLSMMIVGSILADIKIKDIFTDLRVFYGTFVRLILLPVIALLALKAIGTTDMVLDIIVIQVAMPAGITTAILAEKYKANAAFASKLVFMTTLFSIVTIPLFIIFL